jgi:hypothetical protein
MIGALAGSRIGPSLASLQLRSDRFGRQEFTLVDLVLGSKVEEGMPANLCNGGTKIVASEAITAPEQKTSTTLSVRYFSARSGSASGAKWLAAIGSSSNAFVKALSSREFPFGARSSP